MKKLFLLTKTLLVAVMLCVGANAWATAPTLTASYAVDNYAKLCYTNFVDQTIDDGSTYADVFAYGECVFRANYGVQNQNTSSKAITVTKSIQKGDLIIIQAAKTGSYDTYVGVSSAVSNPIKKDGYYAFYVTSNADNFTVTLGRLTYIAAMQILRPSNTTYTVNAVKADGTFLKEIATGNYAEDATIYYPVCVEKEGAYYRKDAVSGTFWGFTNIAAGLRTIVYTAVDYAYYSEAENMNNGGSLLANQGDYPSRFSDGVAKRLGKNQTLYTDALSAGIYNVIVYGRNYKNNNQGGISVKMRNTSGTLTSELGRFESWGSGASSEKTVTGIVVPEDCYISICQDASNSNIDIDYVYVVKTSNDATVSKTISAAGWATYCSPYALDLENATGLTDAYIVTGGADGVLTKTSVKGGTVPANTGLLLKGDEGTATIPVVASSTTNVSANKLVGVTTATVLDLDDDDDGTADKSVYVLLKEDDVLGFYKTTTTSFTVGANTAYLPSDFAGGAARSAYFFDSITGVEAVDAAAEAAQKDGKFVINGQLVIFKNGKKFNAAGAQLY